MVGERMNIATHMMLIYPNVLFPGVVGAVVTSLWGRPDRIHHHTRVATTDHILPARRTAPHRTAAYLARSGEGDAAIVQWAVNSNRAIDRKRKKTTQSNKEGPGRDRIHRRER